MLKLYADAGWQGMMFPHALARVCRAVNVEIVRRCDSGKFVVLPKRCIVMQHRRRPPMQSTMIVVGMIT